MTVVDNDVVPHARAMSIEEFCFLENLSRSLYYKLKRMALGPEETRILNLVRISPEARAKWHAMLAARRQSAAARSRV